jgi:dihydrofolate synthase/folylpolyglutamate synthase
MRFSLSDWLAWQEKLHPNAIDLGLERIRRTLSRLDWKPPRCPVITVGGTNGKGSTVAFLRRILSAGGYRVGTFTSPHLRRYNERICVAEREVSDASLIAAFERIDAARGEDTLTFFEFNTLAALLIFETAHLDAIVLEVGMGGRLDAVNVVDADVPIICSIGLDHCEWLGSNAETIGGEKAGIFRAGKPAIFGAREMPSSVEQAARSLNAPLLRLGRDFHWQVDESTWTWRGLGREEVALPMPALAGAVQFDNASTALAALTLLSERLPVTRTAIHAGLTTVSLPGRFQIVSCEAEWILDVAHNPAAARTLAQQLGVLDARTPTIGVCAVLGDKDLAGIVTELAGRIDGWVAAGLEGPRALSLEELVTRLTAAGANVRAQCPNVAAACSRALELAGPSGRVVVFGSFLTVGPALQWLESRCVTLT